TAMNGDSWGMTDVKYSHLLSSSPEIAEGIFRYMNSRQLNTCVMVCSLWNSTAKRLKRRRTSFMHCFQVWKRKSTSDAPGETADLYRGQLHAAWCEPSHALVFSSCKPWPHPEANCTEDPLEVSSVVSSLLPSACQLLLVNAWDIVDVVGAGQNQAFCGLLVPSVLPDGVRVRPFTVTLLDLWKRPVLPSLGNDWYATDEFKRRVGLREYLMFTNKLPDIILCGFLTSCEPHRFPVGGAALHSFVANGAARYVVCTGLCFLGDGVRAASVVLGPTVRCTAAVDSELRRLKTDSGFGDWKAGRTVGFMFTPLRTYGEHQADSAVEAEAFAGVFPGVPLTGLCMEHRSVGREYLP
ncbi:hypothetical protein IscW_ISCW013612, partial [Ixodes scapularis]